MSQAEQWKHYRFSPVPCTTWLSKQWIYCLLLLHPFVLKLEDKWQQVFIEHCHVRQLHFDHWVGFVSMTDCYSNMTTYATKIDPRSIKPALQSDSTGCRHYIICNRTINERFLLSHRVPLAPSSVEKMAADVSRQPTGAPVPWLSHP